MYDYDLQKKSGPETDESEGYAGHHCSGDGTHPMRVHSHQTASKLQCKASGKGGWAEVGKLYLILACHVFTQVTSVGSAGGLVPRFYEARARSTASATAVAMAPPWLLPHRGPSLPGGPGRPGPASIGQNGQPKWRPESFFFFF